MIRWKGLITVVVLAAILVILSIFFIDRWIESGLEKAGETMAGAKVEIDGFDLKLSPLSASWNRLQVADKDKPMSNLAETGRVAFSMDPGALLRKKTVIKEMTISSLKTGSPRATNGALPPKKKKVKKTAPSKPGPLDKAKEKMIAQVSNLPVMRFDPNALKQKLNLDSLVVFSELKMPAHLDSSKKEITAIASNWETFYKTFQPEADIRKIKDDINSIDPNKLKTVPDIVVALDKIQKSHKTLQALQDTVKTRHKQIDRDFKQISGYTRSIDDWYKADYQAILSKAKLPDLSVKNISMMLFGKSLVYQIQKYIGVVQKIRSYMPKKGQSEKAEKPQRMQGETIHFASRHAWPAFLIEQIRLSGETGYAEDAGIMLDGKASGINTQPWIYGRPTSIQLTGEKTDKRAVTFDASLDHVTDVYRDQFNIQLKQLNLANVSLESTDYLPSKIQKGRADVGIAATFTDDVIDGKITVKAQGLAFDFPSQPSNDQFVRIVRDIIQRLDVITMTITMKGEGDHLAFGMNSNLDDQISGELKRRGSEALANARRQIEGRLDQIKSEKMKEVNNLYQEKESAIRGKIEEYEKELEAQRMAAEAKIEQMKKDLEAKKKSEENKLKDQAKKTLDGLLK